MRSRRLGHRGLEGTCEWRPGAAQHRACERHAPCGTFCSRTRPPSGQQQMGPTHLIMDVKGIQ